MALLAAHLSPVPYIEIFDLNFLLRLKSLKSLLHIPPKTGLGLPIEHSVGTCEDSHLPHSLKLNSNVKLHVSRSDDELLILKLLHLLITFL